MSRVRQMSATLFAIAVLSLMFSKTASAQPWGYYPAPYGPPVVAYPTVIGPRPYFDPRYLPPPPVVVAAPVVVPATVPAPTFYTPGVAPYTYIGPLGRVRVGYAPALYGVGY
ncbi:hypothetical protein [Schlesneria sp. T3-172]|uniref:hypothetical protein n=1 Tax=Schlesneria sphaerica TaxID=3373610 RepID=UPI0037C7110A